MLHFESLLYDFDGQLLPGLPRLFRARVPGGWFCVLKETLTHEMSGVCFVPDPGHRWDGSSLPPNAEQAPGPNPS